MFCEPASGLYLLRLALRQSATHITAPPSYFLGSALVKRSRKHPLIGICSLRQALFSLAFTDRRGHTFLPFCPSFLSSSRLPPTTSSSPTPLSLSDCLCSCQSKETLPLALRLPRLQEKKQHRKKNAEGKQMLRHFVSHSDAKVASRLCLPGWCSVRQCRQLSSDVGGEGGVGRYV